MRTLMVLLAVLIFSPAFGQVQARGTPGGIVLPPGYQYQSFHGTDSWPGKIWKKGGLTIEHDIGPFAGQVDEQRDKWYFLRFSKEQQGAQVMYWGFTVPGSWPTRIHHRLPKSEEELNRLDKKWPKQLRVMFSCPANFWTTVKSQAEFDQALVILRTFKCEKAGYQ
jgi:hypothetical protein